MTYEDAIKKIKQFGLYHAIGDLPNSVFTVQAFELAIEALEKQIPKKPSGSFDDETYGRAWICECTGIIDEYQKFCPCCGQAIDWSGDNER